MSEDLMLTDEEIGAVWVDAITELREALELKQSE